jgi:hypothetical protein
MRGLSPRMNKEYDMSTIHFNGKTYNDLAEMPATERQAYEQLTAIFQDEDQDGVPDVFQGDIVGNLIKAATTKVIVDGKQVSGLGEMSSEQRAKFEKGLAKLQEWGLISQVPDLSGTSPDASWEQAEIRPSKPIIQSPSAIQEESGGARRAIILVAILVAIAICMAGAALYLFMGQ